MELNWNSYVLRVLDLSHHGITNLPASIGKLIHLHYIDLSDTALETLPDSICGLLNLQILRLKNCTSLTSLPKRICNLVKLRHLDIRGSGVREMPLEMHKLKSLRVLTDFIVSESGSGLGELAELSNLQKLTISELQNVANAKDASYAKLKEKESLDVLTLQWGSDNDNEMEVLENLEPHKDLKRLTVDCYGGPRFPNWLGDPSYLSLQSIALLHCENCYSLPALGLLPFLKRLYIEGFAKVSSIGLEFYGVMSSSQKPFQSLEVLHFQDMLEWKEWNILEGVQFPHLIELHIIWCSKLVRGLPNQLLSLKKLEIVGCYDLVAPLPIVSDTCEVCVLDGDKTLMRESHLKPPLGCQLTTSEADQITVKSYSDLPSSSSEFDSDIEETSSGMLSHQGEAYIHNIKQQMDPQSSMTEAPFLVETSSKEELDDQRSSFEVLKVSTISQLKSLPPKLHSLKIEGCESLEDLSHDLLGGITTLKELYLISCSSLRSLSYSSSSLTTLYMSNCRRLEFPSSLESTKKLSFLHHLFISSCNLTTLPLNFFSQLKTLCIWDCPNLLSFDVIGELRGDLASLESLEIKDCPRLECFPDEGLHTPILASILVSNCKNLKKLPKAKNFLTSLKSLFLHRCPQIESFPSGGLPSCLVFLSIADCDKLTPQKEWGLNSLESLDHFELEGGCIGMESFPEENLLPCNINSLRIGAMKSLKKLDYKGFQHLNGLQKLEIHCCNMLRSLPDQGLPSSLSHLCVQECPLLTPRLTVTEDEWHKVAYIPLVQIDHQVFS